jgi:hypothetical protein
MDIDKRRMQLYLLLGPAATNTLDEYRLDNPERFIRDFDWDHLHFMMRVKDHVTNIINKHGAEEVAVETSLPARVCRSIDPKSKGKKALWFHSEPAPRKAHKSEHRTSV